MVLRRTTNGDRGRMLNPWLVAPPNGSVAELAKRLERAHTEPDLRCRRRSRCTAGRARLVAAISSRLKLDADHASPDLSLDERELREYRARHPLSLVLPVIQTLLVRHAVDCGLIVAVGDQSGRLLWIDGDRTLKTKAESMLFVEGADWSEARVGTSAPGTALALDHGIQIQRAEHFNRFVHPWSCTAVPVHDPDSGRVLGVIDITGGDDAVAPQTLPLIEAAVAAVEAELRIRRLDDAGRRVQNRRRPTPTAVRDTLGPTLRVLGRDHATLETSAGVIELSQRHAEILALLSWHPAGLSADRLSDLLFEQAASPITLRAEVARLRRVLAAGAPGVTLSSRPYRVEPGLELDAQRVLRFLDRGAHRVALAAWEGTCFQGRRPRHPFCSERRGVTAAGRDAR